MFLLGLLVLIGNVGSRLRSRARLAGISWARGIFPLRETGCGVNVVPRFRETGNVGLDVCNNLPLTVVITPGYMPAWRCRWRGGRVWSSKRCHSRVTIDDRAEENPEGECEISRRDPKR